MIPVKYVWLLILISFLDLFLSTGTLNAKEQLKSNEMKTLLMFYNEKDLKVESSTRAPIDVSQVTENISIVTKEDIVSYNAHSLADVLERVTGIFVDCNRDFFSNSLISIQGSEPRHVKVLIDDVPINFLSNGAAEIGIIPVGIIERIEIIKGPASSVWGSSLGGIINIITKCGNDEEQFSGSASGSFGASKSQDYRAQIKGIDNKLGYYFFTNHRQSDGIINNRNGESDNFYTKLGYEFSDKIKLKFSLSGNNLDSFLGQYFDANIYSTWYQQLIFSTISTDISISDNFSVQIYGNFLTQKYNQNNNVIEDDFFQQANELYNSNEYTEDSKQLSIKSIWNNSNNTIVAGVDYHRGDLDQAIYSGKLLTAFGALPFNLTRPMEEIISTYINDTVTVGNFTIAPGIRYDYNSVSNSELSPSLGLSYNIYRNTFLKASIARGFTSPPLSWSSGGGLFLAPNPDLKSEIVWSYQFGIESSIYQLLDIKTSLFKHDVENESILKQVQSAPFTNQIVNSDKLISRKGIELEIITKPFYNLFFKGGLSYTDLHPQNARGSKDLYGYNVAFCYIDKNFLSVILSGNYLWWDYDENAELFDAYYSDFVWDLKINKSIFTTENTCLTFFTSINNIFNNKYFTSSSEINPGRWAEFGLRLEF